MSIIGHLYRMGCIYTHIARRGINLLSPADQAALTAWRNLHHKVHG